MPKDWAHISCDVWPMLVEAGKARKKLTYSDVAHRINTNAQSVGAALEYIQQFCKREGCPPLTAVVVGKTSRIPGKGFDWAAYSPPSKLDDEYENIHAFDWGRVNYVPSASDSSKITIEQFVGFAKAFDDQILRTVSQNKPFRVNVGDDAIYFTPQSTGDTRRVLFTTSIEEYLTKYNRGAYKASDYVGNFRNASYFLAVMHEYEKPQHKNVQKQEEDTLQTGKTETESVTKIRIGQEKFRKSLLDFWGGACTVTNIKNKKELLRASHIKPWRDASSNERLNKYNGLLLTPNLDVLFDSGFITFDDSGKIIISSKMSHTDLHKMGVTKKMSLREIHQRHKIFLEYHRENIFRK